MDRSLTPPHRPVGRARGVLPRPDGAALLHAVGLARARLSLRRPSATASIPSPAQKDFHPGIDISTPIGTKVHGARGRHRDLQRAAGRLRQRAHRSTTATAWSRATATSTASTVKPGQRVKRGDVIAYVGQHRPVHGPASPLRGLGSRPGAEPDPLHPRRVPDASARLTKTETEACRSAHPERAASSVVRNRRLVLRASLTLRRRRLIS